MIKKNLGYIVAVLSILISIIIIYQKHSYNQKISVNTSSASTIRTSEEKNFEKHLNQGNSIKYVIQKSDTLWDLSVKYYSDGTKYPEIIKKNPGKTFKFSDGREGLIYPGTELEI